MSGLNWEETAQICGREENARRELGLITPPVSEVNDKIWRQMMPNWWEIKNSTGEDDSPAELLIYGYIGEFDEVSSSDIVNKLKDISSNAINVKIIVMVVLFLLLKLFFLH